MDSIQIKNKQWVTIFVFLVLAMSCNSSYSNVEENKKKASYQLAVPVAENQQKIQLALLLDTSNSMDGLIEQAKSQLWTIVNELATAKCDNGTQPEVKIALFEYGNSGLSSQNGFIRKVLNLTYDLDEISDKLFGLTTNGGDEYCGEVIKTSVNLLEWSKSAEDLKMIFIAGNEPFTQGNITYQSACNLASEKGIIVNTIFCGNHEEGINTSWKRGADITKGSYMSIEQNKKTVYIKTPHDDQIDQLNDQLNSTYVYYGNNGRLKKDKQLLQDSNASSYGQANKVKRAISKSAHVYKNSSWDLVDAIEINPEILDKVDANDLPSNMKEMSTKERQAYINEQALLRKKIQKEIRNLSVKRKQFIANSQANTQKGQLLDQAMIQAIKKQARLKSFTFN